jgi:hypothetical protein
MSTTTAAPRAPYPYEIEVATAVTAAVEAALAKLRARPPAECARCGGRTFDPPPSADRAVGWWRCQTCFRPTRPNPPTPAEEAEATAKARAEATDRVLEPGNAILRRQIAFDRTRDRRRPAAVYATMRAALLARYAPARYAPPRSREWEGAPLVDFARKDAELRDDVETFDRPRACSPAARSAAGATTGSARRASTPPAISGRS